ncbi:MAG: cation-translocating P-type ATPase [Verrucomicrobiales bacterium]
MNSGEMAGEVWQSRTGGEVLENFRSRATGLSREEAGARLAETGPNLLKEGKKVSPLKILLSQFSSLIVWILIFAGILSGFLGDGVDAIAILAIVVLNAVIGFYQEYNAEKSIAALKKMAAPGAKVWRDGLVRSVPAAEVVPGDILEFEAGDLVAADARLLAASSLKCVEASLTGESNAVEKNAEITSGPETPLGDRGNMIFMGTSVAAGSGRGVVVATAMQTEIGRIAGLLDSTGEDEETPLQKKLTSFGRILVWASLGIVALLFGLGLLRGMPFLEMFMTAVSLAVASVPEGLPTVVTIALALGVMRMSRRHALVRKLPSVETLGSTNVICTDKTGTLTIGEMTVRVLYVAGHSFDIAGEGYEPEGEILIEGRSLEARHLPPLLELSNCLIGCNNSHLVLEDGVWKVIGDPTEGAMLSAGHKAGGSKDRLEKKWPKHHEIPFDSDRKRQSVVRMLPDGGLRAYINGAPDLLLKHCTRIFTAEGIRSLAEDDRTEILARNADLAGRGLRVLGSACRDLDTSSPDHLTAETVEQDLIFVGLTGMYDPPRPEAKEAIAKCHQAGIRVVMITGDHPKTAVAVGRELGIVRIDETALTGADLDRLGDEALLEQVDRVAVYARVTAAHKLRIVRALKSAGAVVAMTGDGVNDAPAIKGADIGIAMGRTGTEVTKQAADMIITDDNFASIVAAVEEGRGIYDNIRKTLQYLLAGNCGELMLITAAIVMGVPMPLIALHLLWINLITDGLPAICLATDPIHADVMRQLPRARHERITDGGFLGTMFITGFFTAGVSMAVYLYAFEKHGLEIARTHAFATLVFSELLRAFGARSETRPLWRINQFTNVRLIAVVVISFAIQLCSHQIPALAGFLKTAMIPFSDGLILMAVGTIPLLAMEGVKAVRTSRRRRREAKAILSPIEGS